MSARARFSAAVVFSLLLTSAVCWSAGQEIVVGTKAFTEGYLLGEVTAQTLEKSFVTSKAGKKIVRRFGMGGTGILYQALQSREIDLYPEYTGTISEAILKNPNLQDWQEIQKALAPLGLMMSPALGFNNTYGIAVHKAWAQEHAIQSLTDLAREVKESRLMVRAGFSHEFMTRQDGYSGLIRRYQLDFAPVSSMEHSLAYEAIEQNKLDAIDIYSTDAKIEKLNLLALEDDRHYFPRYDAVILTRIDFPEKHPEEWKALTQLQNTISTQAMIHMNKEVDIDRQSFADVVNQTLDGGVGRPQGESKTPEFWMNIWQRTKEHLFLVGVSLLVSILIGLPLGIIAFEIKRLAQTILLVSGVLQTIPSLALLCFLIPFFGVGTKAALVALILYSLLPIILNTYVGLRSVEPIHRENARALGLTYWQRLRLIELPLSSASILTGIKTSATIGIGTATLAALIGAGGYGVPIVTGLAINDMPTILTGAIPAALMAFAAHGIFEALSRWLVPKVGPSPGAR